MIFIIGVECMWQRAGSKSNLDKRKKCSFEYDLIALVWHVYFSGLMVKAREAITIFVLIICQYFVNSPTHCKLTLLFMLLSSAKNQPE